MRNCDECQARLLEHLYGLLEPEESGAVADHLDRCADCRLALARAQGQKQVLAAASRSEFPGVRFEAPDQAPEFLVLRPYRRLVPWAVAAAVLLAVGGLGVPGAVYWRQQARVERAELALRELEHEGKQVAREHQARLDAAVVKVRDARVALNDAAEKKRGDLRALSQAIKERPVHVVVSGPPALQPGAPNEFQVETYDQARRPVAADVTAKVVDGSRRVVYEARDLRTEAPGIFRLKLPADLPVKPDGDLYLLVSAATEKGRQGGVSERLSLAAPVYVTHLATDKPMYQPGEVVHFRSLTLERFSLKPAAEDLRIGFTVTDPQGAEKMRLERLDQVVSGRSPEQGAILGPDGKPVRGIGAGEFALPADAAGGEYTLTVREAGDRFAPQTRKFLVNRYEKPRINKELEFTARSYGPGDTVTAACKATRVEGPVANRDVVATVQVDGKRYGADGKPGDTAEIRARTDARGEVAVRFTLPASVERGEASLAVNFIDRDVSETIVRPIPIALKKLQVEFFPEGGDLVAGVPCRVYFESRTMLDRPAEVKGRVVDDRGAVVVADVHTFNEPSHPGANQGMGVFTLTPASGRKYELKIDAPTGIEGRHLLPEVKAGGVVLTVATGVTTDRDPIRAEVRSGDRDRTLIVGAYCRGRLMTHERVEVKKGAARDVELRPEGGVGGVYRVTVFDERGPETKRQLVPVAERLIYRAPGRRLDLDVRPDRKVYLPGDKVTLSLGAADEKGRPAAAVLMAAVVDRSVVALADDKTDRSMPTHFFLTTEVRRPEDLEHADFLLSDQPGAAVALDLLLGTQGWRRFAEQDPKLFREKEKDEADRLLVMSGVLTPQKAPGTTDLDAEQVRETREQAAAALAALEGKVLTAEAQLDAVEKDEHFRGESERLHAAAVQAFELAVGEANTLNRYKDFARTYGPPALAVLVLVLLVVGVLSLTAGLKDSTRPRALTFFVTAACSVLLVGLFLTTKSNPTATEVAWNWERMGAPRVGGAGAEDGGRGQLARGAGNVQTVQPLAVGPAVPPPIGPGPAKGATPPRIDEEAIRKKLEERRLAGLLPPEGTNEKGMRPPAPPGPAGAQRPPAAWLRQNGRLLAEQQLAIPGEPPVPPLPGPFVVREYAHRHARAHGGERADWTETLYWNPVLVLPRDGKAEVSFDLNDSVTSFQVVVAGHTLDGRIGAVTMRLDARKPVTLEPKLPVEVGAGDQIDVPLAIGNHVGGKRTVRVHVTPVNLNLVRGTTDDQLTLEGGERTRRVYRLQPAVLEGEARFDATGGDGEAADTVSHTLRVVPDGFPVVVAHSDLLEHAARHEVVLPRDWVRGTLRCQVTAYPSTLAELQKGLEGLLREPCGCFEQASSSNYPNVLAMQYLKENEPANPEFARRAKELLAGGYERLASYECREANGNRRQGYEWFGGTAPPHEALSAYGLMQFRDMAAVYPVDQEMVGRTRNYLMSRRDGAGGFLRNQKAIDTFGRAPDDITNAYIVWALTEGGKDDDVSKELTALAGQAATSTDPYFLALVANSLLNRGRADEAADLLRRLSAAQKEDGHLDAGRTSITGSAGRDLQIETTALALLAWLKANRPADFTAGLQKAVRWLGRQRGGHGGFGSTQGTVLSLKALIAFARANKKTAEAGDLRITAGGQVLAARHFEAGVQEALVLDLADPEKYLHPGRNELGLEITGKNAFPYTLAVSYRTATPLSAGHCPLRLATRLDRDTAGEGETVRLSAVVENRTDRGHGMAVAILGLPAGLTLSEDMKQLKDLARWKNDGTEPGLISAWETRGRELVLYWRDLAPRQKTEINLDLVCRVPGEYRGPASRAYLYYNADHKCWVEPLKMAIRAKAGS